MELIRAEQIIKERLPLRRFEHSLRVAATAGKLAVRWGVDERRAFLAGILHDYARDMPGEELLSLARDHGLVEDPVEELVPDLLHAAVGAVLVESAVGLGDQEVLQAIGSHTLGRIGMSPLEKIIFLADMIEPGRDFPGIEKLRRAAEQDLDRAMVLGIDATLAYCLKKGSPIHSRTVRVRNYFLASLPA